MKAYQILLNKINKIYKTNIELGLTEVEANQRLKKYGKNALPTVPKENIFHIFFRQFKSPLIYILLISAVIIFFLGYKMDAWIISIVLMFNAIIGTLSEERSLDILESLKTFVKTETVVLRNGEKKVINNEDLVVGDIIYLHEGERISADARVVESNNFQVDESILTGESSAIIKKTEAIEGEVPIFKQNNMVFNGTYALLGNAKAIVTAIGTGTEVGKLNISLTEKIDTETPLKREYNRLSRWILLFIFIICIFLLIIGLVTGQSPKELLVTLVALFICVIPEGLPVVLTLVLVRGVYMMAKNKVLVKKMQAVETLGRTNVLVIDKTGTLTRNEMVVTKVFTKGKIYNVTGEGYFINGKIFCNGTETTNKELTEIGQVSSLLNRSEIAYIPKLNLFNIKGDPTEAAMYVLSQKLNIVREDLEKDFLQIHEILFTTDNWYHAVFYKKDNEGVVYITSSPEIILDRCINCDHEVHSILNKFLKEGLRVIFFAKKTFDLKDQNYKAIISKNLEFLGFMGIQDSIRHGVKEDIETVKNAGIDVAMMTGDHQKTALYVAKKVGIYEEGNEALDFEETDFDENEILKNLENIKVFSRVSPNNKLKIVNLFHKKHKIVAMTGDGINDVPSMIAADLGIAMGNIGTEITKKAADIVLLDDSFSSILKAIELGRHIFSTFKKVILYFLTTNMGEVFVIFLAIILNLPMPLLVVQILWLNLITDGFLDMALAMEPIEKDILEKANLNNKFFIDKNLFIRIIYMATPMAIGSIYVFYHYIDNLAKARTMTLVTMALFQWFNAWNCRSIEKSIFTLGLFKNKWLVITTLFVLGLQILILYVPFLQKIFRTVPIDLMDWLVLISISSSILIIEEIRKFIFNKFYSSI